MQEQLATKSLAKKLVTKHTLIDNVAFNPLEQQFKDENEQRMDDIRSIMDAGV